MGTCVQQKVSGMGLAVLPFRDKLFPMNHDPNRIKNRRQARGWTLQQLADASGTSKSQIDKLEKGERRLTVDWMVRLAKPLGCDPRELLPDQVSELKTVAFTEPVAPPSTLPVKGAARGGKAQEMFITDGPIDHVPRPHYLQHVKDAYAIYVVGDSMAPMYRPGQLLFVNPYKPPTAGSGVVIVQPDGAVLIKEFVKQKSNGVVLREYRPTPRDFTLPQTAIATMHSVSGATEPQ